MFCAFTVVQSEFEIEVLNNDLTAPHAHIGQKSVCVGLCFLTVCFQCCTVTKNMKRVKEKLKKRNKSVDLELMRFLARASVLTAGHEDGTTVYWLSVQPQG